MNWTKTLKLSDQLSLAPLRLTLLSRTDLEIGTATGFATIGITEGPRLITNWHVLSGRDWQTGELIHASGATPVRLKIRHISENQSSEPWASTIEDLYDSDGKPLWFEHHSHGASGPTKENAIDIAALPLTKLSGIELLPFDLNNPAPCGRPALDVGSRLFAIGYPNGNPGSANTALWTNLTIGSSLSFNFLPKRPTFAVNGSTRQGQSGAPVVRFSGPDDAWITTDGSFIANGQTQFYLAGIYSGQIDSRSSEIGIVWSPDLITEVALSGSKPIHLALDPSELPD